MIEKIFFGFASVLALEGLMLALFPRRIKKIVQLIEELPETKLAVVGLFMLVLGTGLLLLIEI